MQGRYSTTPETMDDYASKGINDVYRSSNGLTSQNAAQIVNHFNITINHTQGDYQINNNKKGQDV